MSENPNFKSVDTIINTIDFDRMARDIAAEQEKIAARRQATLEDEYLTQLTQYIDTHDAADTQSVTYGTAEGTPEEMAMLGELYYFVDAVGKYASDNYLEDEFLDNGLPVRYNDTVLEVGTMVGQGSIAWVRSSEIHPDESHAIEDIRTGTKTERAQHINTARARFAAYATEFLDNGVPGHVLQSTLREQINVREN